MLRLAPHAGGRLTWETIPDAGDGLSRSLRAGARAAMEAGRDLMVMLPDMPDIESADLARLVAARAAGTRICRACAEDGTPGHPVLFDRGLLEEFALLEGDRGAAEIVRANGRALTDVPLAGRRACRDLDTPADWAAYLSG
jgi:CTP:molybdopterin cytidylyltransferase MocA